MARVLNFGPGPSMLPESVLKRMQAELLDYHGCGWSIVEASHRGTEVQALMRDLRAAVRDLLAIPDNYDILFCQGGGRLQFAMVPMNLLGASPVASYLVTGTWSKTAAKEAMRFAKTQLAFSGNGTRLPVDEEIDIVEGAAYCYYCDNETIHGLEFPTIPEPDLKGAPLVADMSSNFMSRPIDVERFGLFWAAAQNNLGIAGLTVVVIRRDLLGLASPDVPTLMNYGVYSRTSSIPNTPPVFQLYAAKLMAEWIAKEGGVALMNERAKARSALIYEVIDSLGDFYLTRTEARARSRMNVAFRLRTESLTQDFIKAAEDAGLYNLAGHRSVGGLRASMYNAMPLEGAERLASFIRGFADKHARSN